MLSLKVFKKASCVLFINKRIFLCTLFRLIFIDLQNVGVISAAPCTMYKIMCVFTYTYSQKTTICQIRSVAYYIVILFDKLLCFDRMYM